MKNRLIKVAGAVPQIRIGDIRYNTEQIIEVINANHDCGLIVFPELSVTGYTCADLFQSSLLPDEAVSAVIRIAGETARTGGCFVWNGYPIRGYILR